MEINSSTISTVEIVSDFICQLVFKDELAGTEAETQSSAAAASEYTAAYLKIDNKTQDERDSLIANYVEANPYYKKLLDTYGIQPYTSRLAKDLDIIFQPSTYLSEYTYLQLYRGIYKDCLTAFYATSYSKAFEEKPNYRALCKYILNLTALMNLLHKWLENPFDIDLMDEYQLDKFTTSFGIPYFSSLPVNYKRQVAKNLNRLISRKGTDQVIIDILDIFNFQNIDIFKFYLAKNSTVSEVGTQDTNYLKNITRKPQFLSHNIRIPSLNIAIKNNQYRKDDIDSVTQDDDRWQVNISEIQKANFDYVQTKYFSIESGFELAKESMSTIFAINMIKQIREKYPVKDQLKLNITSISANSLFIEDVIIALQILTLNYNNIEDYINYDLAGIAGVYQFNNKDSDKLNSTVFNILDPNEKKAVTLTNMDEIGSFTKPNLISTFNNNYAVYEKILSEMKKTTSFRRYKKLQALYKYKFVQDLSYTVYNGSVTLSDYLNTRNADLYKFVRNIMDINNDQERVKELEKQIVFLTDTITEYLDTITFFLGSTSISILADYLKKVILTFKSFTVSLKNLDIFIIIKENSRQKITEEVYFKNIATYTTDLPSLADGVAIKSNIKKSSKARASDKIKITVKT